MTESLVKKILKEEWPTMGNHLLACGVAMATSRGAASLSQMVLESDAAISAITSVFDQGVYIPAFVGQLIYRDRHKFKDSDGHYNPKKIGKKFVEYLTVSGVPEGIYFVARSALQYYFQKKGYNPENVTTAIQATATILYTFILPTIRYGMRQWSEKEPCAK